MRQPAIEREREEVREWFLFYHLSFIFESSALFSFVRCGAAAFVLLDNVTGAAVAASCVHIVWDTMFPVCADRALPRTHTTPEEGS